MAGSKRPGKRQRREARQAQWIGATNYQSTSPSDAAGYAYSAPGYATNDTADDTADDNLPMQSRMLMDIASLKIQTRILVDNNNLLVESNKQLRTVIGTLRAENHLSKELMAAAQARMYAMERMGVRLMVATGFEYGQKDTWTRGWNIDTGRFREVSPGETSPGEANNNETEESTAGEEQKTEETK
ncbi:hypothetical protein CONLIGDRAFT_638090 [Coniochaeta ligniaria NRRL 30616]|uniref:Uncharacterized protein n=1 Tax=Coniochaeta ligniaria NRRL 30616 TaxID=1408157 RepID=A0A1J7IP13_9PEZI|nr:hypothetical protein CONLIGDRAFT_638090 [Coniochaeta ligniaria NRRL 30616]